MDLSLERLIMMIPLLVIALPVHELAHGYVAYKLGDPTAKDAGRLTLNPLKHLDPIGVIMMLVARVGWAKPVPVNSSYFKNRRAGMILVSMAGPLSNLLLAFIFMMLWGLVVKLITIGTIVISTAAMETFIGYLIEFFYVFVFINISLAIFNLIPVPPLDGSRLISAFIPEESYYRFARYEQFVGLAFIVLVMVLPDNAFSGFIRFFADPIYNSMESFVNFVFRL
jgi:Zn-dependent protease